LYTPEPVARADFFVNCPKFKAHPWTTVTFSMKNYIGIQDDRHRLIDHDHMLDRKVADLQYIIQPQLVAIDAIIAGEGRMLTPLPFDLGLVVLGDNQVAVDAVCCMIIGIDPRSVAHIRLAWERGFGPVDLSAIRVEGDVSLDEAKARARGFRSGLVKVDEYFANTSIRAYGGPPPGGTVDYCWGGCPGALEEAIEILRLFDPGTDRKLPPVHIVFGRHEGPIPAKDGETVIFMGDCATWKGTLGGAPVEVADRYVDRSHKDPLEARAEDIFVKMLRTKRAMAGKAKIVQLGGCPVSVAEQVLALVELGHLENPYLDPSEATRFMSCYLQWRTRQAVNRVMGRPYNVPGPSQRGAARPAQNLPPEPGAAS
jgi:hypothetical protein